MANSGPMTLNSQLSEYALIPSQSSSKPLGKPSYFLGIALVGSIFLVADPLLINLLNLNSQYLGFMLLNGAVIGLSTHLSHTLDQPKYNLWTKLQELVRTQPLMVLMISPGIAMGNLPLVTIGLSTGILANRYYSPKIKEFEHDVVLLQNYAQKEFTQKKLKSWWHKNKELPFQNKGRSLSLICGAGAGLVLYTLMAPTLNPITSDLNQGCYWLLTSTGGLMANHVTGGLLFHGLLTMTALGYNFYNTTFPIVVLTGAGAWLSYHTWEKLRKTTEKAALQSKKVADKCLDFTQEKIALVKTIWHKCKQTFLTLPSQFYNKVPSIPRLSLPERPTWLDARAFAEPCLLLMFRHQMRDLNDYPGFAPIVNEKTNKKPKVP